MLTRDFDVLRDRGIDSKAAWRNTIVVLAIFIVALIVALIIRF